MSRFNRWSTAEQVSEGIDLSGRHAIVTGANTGIGLETTRVLALRGSSVTMACRNLEKAQAARRRVVSESGGRIAPDSLRPLHLDLASLDSVRAFARELLTTHQPIHLLINNAGVMLPDRRETRDGFEAHLGINHLGHFLLTQLLLDRVCAGAPARIVNVSSDAMHFASLTPKFSDLNWENRRFSGWRSYGDQRRRGVRPAPGHGDDGARSGSALVDEARGHRAAPLHEERRARRRHDRVRGDGIRPTGAGRELLRRLRTRAVRQARG
jgi:hypothetical protein